MGSSMIRYKVRPDRADENESLVKAVYEQLNRERPDSLRYATFKLPDGVSFMHLVFETDRGRADPERDGRLYGLRHRIASRCDEPPVVTELSLVGSYGYPT